MICAVVGLLLGCGFVVGVAVGGDVGVGGTSVAFGEGGFDGVRVGIVWRSWCWIGEAQVLRPIVNSSSPTRTVATSSGTLWRLSLRGLMLCSTL